MTYRQLQTGMDRLAKVAQHLNNMPTDKFDFGEILQVPDDTDIDTSDLPKQRKNWSCGGVGCAIGEFPVIFPRHFKYLKHHYDSSRFSVCLKTERLSQAKTTEKSFADLVPQLAGFFYLSEFEFINIFVAKEGHHGWEVCSNFDGWRWRGLPVNAKPSELASLIQEVIADKLADHVAMEVLPTTGEP